MNMKALTEVFTDPVKLEVAQAVLSAIPDDLSELDLTCASLSVIVINAYRQQITDISLEESETFQAEKVKYIEDHNIMYRLKEAGYVESAGFFGAAPLWVKPKEKNK